MWSNVSCLLATSASVASTFYYLLSHATEGHVIARGKTGIAFFDYEKGATASIPETFLARMGHNH